MRILLPYYGKERKTRMTRSTDLMVGLGMLQLTRLTLTLPFQIPCQGWVEAPARPWEWNGPLSTRLCLSPMLQP